jgi:hypothetical protein
MRDRRAELGAGLAAISLGIATLVVVAGHVGRISVTNGDLHAEVDTLPFLGSVEGMALVLGVGLWVVAWV